MTDVAVSVEGLGKRYRIVHQRDPYGRLTESLSRKIRAPLDRARGKPRETSEWIWALQDVSFELRRGDVVGIIGRNGAGKSTLLKILSRITEPTKGKADLFGRVASLLEVGTGFHPELTGRENIYLSGSILGMRKAETQRRFDEIVAFAGVDKFLDTPVKRYSSGMQVRLGFAVAAHLEPEILFVDEVLAVGDAAFQAKCLGRLEEIGQSGRTVIFVSHSMPAVLRLCERAILLDDGSVKSTGASHEVIRAYLDTGQGTSTSRCWDVRDVAPGDEVARLKSVSVRTERGVSSGEVHIDDAIVVEVEYWALSVPEAKLHVNVLLTNTEGVVLFSSSDWSNQQWWVARREPGLVRSTCHIPAHFLAEGQHLVAVTVMTSNPTVIHALERDVVSFVVVDRTAGDGVRRLHPTEWPGVLRPMLRWTVASSTPEKTETYGGE